MRVIASEERHITIDRSLRFLGFGTSGIESVATDNQGRMIPDDLALVLAEGEGPVIVCTQAGNVNTGSFDPFEEIVPIAREHESWIHVDGAFGLWAAACPAYENLTHGVELADSWATDGHKMLNVPYDSGFVFCRHPASHRAAMSVQASYLIQSDGALRDEMDWVPEFSRRARGFATYAALKQLGRSGLIRMVEGTCAAAQRFAERLSQEDDVEILNDVVFNQVLIRFPSRDGDHDARTRAVVGAVQDDGTCWLSGSRWHDVGVMRISVSNWSTTLDDVDRSVDAILKAARSV